MDPPTDRPPASLVSSSDRHVPLLLFADAWWRPPILLHVRNPITAAFLATLVPAGGDRSSPHFGRPTRSSTRERRAVDRFGAALHARVLRAVGWWGRRRLSVSQLCSSRATARRDGREVACRARLRRGVCRSGSRSRSRSASSPGLPSRSRLTWRSTLPTRRAQHGCATRRRPRVTAVAWCPFLWPCHGRSGRSAAPGVRLASSAHGDLPTRARPPAPPLARMLSKASA